MLKINALLQIMQPQVTNMFHILINYTGSTFHLMRKLDQDADFQFNENLGFKWESMAPCREDIQQNERI